MNVIKAPIKFNETHANFRVLERAREAVTTLRMLKPLLSSQDEETLSILIDQELVQHLERSLKEAEKGKREPLKNILK